MVKKINIKKLEEQAKKLRIKILQTIFKSKTGHIGGSLSIVEILVAIYYTGIFKIRPNLIKNKNRDRIIVSKGHCTAAFYSMLSNLGLLRKTK